MAANVTENALKVIIDTDVGGDDMIGLLMAMAAIPSTMQVLAFTTVFGNVNVEKSLRNVIAMFYILWREMLWREERDMEFSYGAFEAFRPTVSLGSGHALGQPVVIKTNGRPYGQDGVWNFHEEFPDFTPDQSWKSLFSNQVPRPRVEPEFYQYFNTSEAPSHKDILRILREEPDNSVTIIALGPLTNIALAAAEDPATFLRAKELLLMGGAVNVPGNISPVSEANAYNDALAAARIYALSASDLASTFPTSNTPLAPYPERLPRQLNVTIFPMDLTDHHCVTYNSFIDTVKPLAEEGSPLSTLAYTFMKGIHDNCLKDCVILEDTQEECITLHDPVPIWYALDRANWTISAAKDLRVESLGQWTKGMHVEYPINSSQAANAPLEPGTRLGNRIHQALESPGREKFQEAIMRLFTV